MLTLTHPAWPLMTERLTLRPFVARDIDAVFAYRSDPQVVKYTYRPHHVTREQTMAYLGRCLPMPAKDGDWLTLAVCVTGEERVIGEACLKFASLKSEQGEIGYVFSPDVAGRGYATEAMRAVVDLAFRHYGFHRLIARIDEANPASVRVAERLGMRLEARLVENDRLDGQWSSELDFAVLDREWERQGTSGALSGGGVADGSGPGTDLTQEAAR